MQFISRAIDIEDGAFIAENIQKVQELIERVLTWAEEKFEVCGSLNSFFDLLVIIEKMRNVLEMLGPVLFE